MFQGKKVFITGGANGIGRALVQSFMKEKACVAFCDKDTHKGEELSRETGALFFEVEISVIEQLTAVMQQVFDTFGDIDILINNAGLALFTPLHEATISQFDYVLSSNLRSAFVTSQILAVHRRNNQHQQNYGRIINISSTRYLMSEPGSEAYAASKGGVVALTHALALSLSDYNITVNSISPGWIETGDYQALTTEDHAQHPSGRVGTLGDIIRVVHFLCHPDNDFINAEDIRVDGGMTRKMIYS